MTSAEIAALEAEDAALTTAITKIVSGGQAYTADGRTMSRADLATLYKRRKEIRLALDRASRGGAVSYVVPV